MEGGPSESIFLGLDEIQSILGNHRRASKKNMWHVHFIMHVLEHALLIKM